jgi:hyperosmotically inducible periplasmic protein
MKMLALTVALALGLWGADRTPEQKLIRQVRLELVTLPFYGVFDNLLFELRGRTVVLKGQVARPSLKPDAERAVRTVDGIEDVVNEIEVLPTSPNDDRIRIATYRAIYADNVLYRYGLQAVPPIHIIVKNGNVTLVGVVASEMDKNVAGIRANGVNGVFNVSNKLRIDGGK